MEDLAPVVMVNGRDFTGHPQPGRETPYPTSGITTVFDVNARYKFIFKGDLK